MKKIKQKCQYNFSNCQKQAIGQHILKLGAVKIDKGWICGNCQPKSKVKLWKSIKNVLVVEKLYS